MQWGGSLLCMTGIGFGVRVDRPVDSLAPRVWQRKSGECNIFRRALARVWKISPIPRSLKLPEGCMQSILRKTEVPARKIALSGSLRKKGVRTCSGGMVVEPFNVDEFILRVTPPLALRYTPAVSFSGLERSSSRRKTRTRLSSTQGRRNGLGCQGPRATARLIYYV